MNALARANNIADLRALARRRLPRPVFDYMDGGADDELSLRRNSSAFADYEIIPDVLTDVSRVATETTLFGERVASPLMISPTGLNRMFHADAELAVARATAKHGLLYSLSTLGTTRLEEIAKAFAGPKVFQIYVFKDRGLTSEFVARWKEAGFHGLALHGREGAGIARGRMAVEGGARSSGWPQTEITTLPNRLGVAW